MEIFSSLARRGLTEIKVWGMLTPPRIVAIDISFKCAVSFVYTLDCYTSNMHAACFSETSAMRCDIQEYFGRHVRRCGNLAGLQNFIFKELYCVSSCCRSTEGLRLNFHSFTFPSASFCRYFLRSL
jgi:hypothetical protein